MSETLVLDPAAVASSDRTELDITPYVRWEGVDWGDIGIEPYMSDQEIGAIPIDFSIPNRQIRVPLNILDLDRKTFAQIRSELQAIVGLWQARGGWIGRTVGATTVYADVVYAALRLGGSTPAALQHVDPDAELIIEVIPEWYEEDWVELDAMSGTGEIVGVLREGGRTAVIRGDFPRGNRCRIVLTDTSGKDQRGVICALRPRNYDIAATAALSYEAEALTPLDTARSVGLSGASGGSAVGRALTQGWLPVLGSAIGGTADMTHEGTFRFVARAYSEYGDRVKCRLAWGLGDLMNPVVNAAWTMPPAPAGIMQAALADLGVVRILRHPVGDQRWVWEIDAKGDTESEAVYFDKVWLVPLDDFYARLAVNPPQGASAAAASARDEFGRAAAVITGQTADVGGRWSGAGDADDFATDGAGALIRTATSDADSYTGRFITLGSSTSSESVSIRSVICPSLNAGDMSLVLARFVDSRNWIGAGWRYNNTRGFVAPSPEIVVLKMVGGSPSVLGGVRTDDIAPTLGYGFTLAVGSDGFWSLATYAGGVELPHYGRSGYDDVLATGGALEAGRGGLYDVNTDGTGGTRMYVGFAIAPVASDAVIYGRGTAELRTDGCYRASGAYFAPITAIGSLPRLPAGSAELFVKNSRGNFAVADAALDAMTATVHYRPGYLAVPDGL